MECGYLLILFNSNISHLNTFDFNTLKKIAWERGQTDRQTDRRTSRPLDRIGPVGQFGENPAYGRHRISRPMWLIALRNLVSHLYLHLSGQLRSKTENYGEKRSITVKNGQLRKKNSQLR